MSELKATTVYDAYWTANSTWQGTGVLVYLKSEADKVIAELEERIADGDKDFEMANNQNERLLKIVRHHKYKRCLAMAELCNEKWLVHNFEKIPTKLGFYDKWHKRWLELAEKFKPNN